MALDGERAMSLRTLQARWTLDRIAPERVHEAATDLLCAGVETPAVVELAGMYHATYFQVGPVLERAVAEAGLGPMTREQALWRLAYEAARRIAGGAVTPLDGAAALWRLCNDLDMPVPLRYFVYLAADYGEGPGDRAAEEAWFDARIRETATDLLAAMPPDGESAPREPVPPGAGRRE